MRHTAAYMATSLWILTTVFPVYGQITTDWIATTDDHFFLDTNWSNGKPGALDTAQFQFNALQFVLLDEDTQITELRLFNATDQIFYGQHNLIMEFMEVFEDAELNLDDQTDFVTNLGFTIGNSNDGTLSIFGGSSFKSNASTQNIFGKEANARGELLVTGGGSSMQSGSLTVGEEGIGNIDVQNGGTVSILNDTTVGRLSTARGTISIDSNSLFETNGDIFVADAPNSDGEIFVDGSNAQFLAGNSVGDDLVVGTGGLGTLDIRNLAQAVSQNVVIGQEINSVGNAMVVAGGILDVEHDLTLGGDPGATGQLRVAGALGGQRSQTNMQSPTSYLVVGSAGTGTLMVDTLAELNASDIVVGNLPGSTGTLEMGANGVLNCNILSIANSGTATMAVNNATVNCTRVDLGVGNGDATLTLTGNTNFTTDRLEVVNEGSAEIIVSGGASLIVPGVMNMPGIAGPLSPNTPTINISNGSDAMINDMTLGSNAFGPGQITVADSDFTVTGDCNIAFNGTMILRNSELLATTVLNDGQLVFDSGFANLNANISVFNVGMVEATTNQPVNFLQDLHNEGEVFVGANGRVNIFGTWSGNGDITGTGDLHFKGGMAPENIGSSSQIEPDTVIEQSATYFMQIGGSSLSDYDSLVFLGDLDIQNANLNVELVNGFQWTDGQAFLLAEVVGQQMGQFGSFPEGSTVGVFDGVELQITYQGGNGNDIVLTAVDSPVLLGDVNLDGVINLLDVAPMVDRISNGVFQAEADCNQDGEVDLLDVAPFIEILTGV